jgi:hypothetical protein
MEKIRRDGTSGTPCAQPLPEEDGVHPSRSGRKNQNKSMARIFFPTILTVLQAQGWAKKNGADIPV